jgi:hypothetical protein
MTSRLSFSWRTRPEATLAGEGVATGRHHLDFIIDAQSLYELLGTQKLDLVGVLGWSPPARDDHAVAELLLEAPGSQAGGRQKLFVCPECGDIGCGAITVMVSLQGDNYVWRDFGYENDYDPNMADFSSYAAVGPYQFEATQYRAALETARRL